MAAAGDRGTPHLGGEGKQGQVPVSCNYCLLTLQLQLQLSLDIFPASSLTDTIVMAGMQTFNIIWFEECLMADSTILPKICSLKCVWTLDW